MTGIKDALEGRYGRQGEGQVTPPESANVERVVQLTSEFGEEIERLAGKIGPYLRKKVPLADDTEILIASHYRFRPMNVSNSNILRIEAPQHIPKAAVMSMVTKIAGDPYLTQTDMFDSLSDPVSMEELSGLTGNLFGQGYTFEQLTNVALEARLDIYNVLMGTELQHRRFLTACAEHAMTVKDYKEVMHYQNEFRGQLYLYSLPLGSVSLVASQRGIRNIREPLESFRAAVDAYNVWLK